MQKFCLWDTHEDGAIQPEDERGDADDGSEEDEEEEGDANEQPTAGHGEVVLPAGITLDGRRAGDLRHSRRLPQLVAHAIHLVHHLHLQHGNGVVLRLPAPSTWDLRLPAITTWYLRLPATTT